MNVLQKDINYARNISNIDLFRSGCMFCLHRDFFFERKINSGDV